MRRDRKSTKTSRPPRTRAKEQPKEIPSERMLWHALRDRAVNGLRFRRQHLLDDVVLDFFCPEVKLCVQLVLPDAPREPDPERMAQLQARGLRVIRVLGEEVEADLPAVLRQIAAAATRYPATSFTALAPPHSIRVYGSSRVALSVLGNMPAIGA